MCVLITEYDINLENMFISQGVSNEKADWPLIDIGDTIINYIYSILQVS